MRLLPLRPRPELSESFASWVQRVASANGLALEDFVRVIRVRYAEAAPKGRRRTSSSPFSKITPDSIECEPFVVQMAAATDVAAELLTTSIWRSEKYWYFHKFLTPAGKKHSSKENLHPGENSAWHADSYCPECLAEKYYLQRLWRPAFPCVCLIHERVLLDRCPGCQTVLSFYDKHPSVRGTDQNRAVLPCQRCGFNLNSIPRQVPAPQHSSLIKFFSQFYMQPSVSRYDEDAVALHVFHWWMEAFFQTCTVLARPPMVHRSARLAQQRAAYTHQSCRVRYALFEAACKAIGRAGHDAPPWEPEDSDCMDWLGTRKWSDFRNVSARLVTMFPELAQQSNIRAPDRAILPS